MSAVCVLTPVIIGSWPIISAAVAGAVTSMGFSFVSAEAQNQLSETTTGTNSVETEIPHSEVLESTLRRGEEIIVTRGDITVRVGVDNRGRAKVCVDGPGQSKAALKLIGDEVVGRVQQQFAYHKLMSELKSRNFSVIDEKVGDDQSISIRVRTNG